MLGTPRGARGGQPDSLSRPFTPQGQKRAPASDSSAEPSKLSQSASPLEKEGNPHRKGGQARRGSPSDVCRRGPQRGQENHGTCGGQGSDTEEKRRESQSMERTGLQDSTGAAVNSHVEVGPYGFRGVPGDGPRFFNQDGCSDRACTAQSGGSGGASTQLAVERLLQLLHVNGDSDARPRMLALLSQGLPETQHVLQIFRWASQLCSSCF